ncbi:MAG TPA: hypothetical protein VNT24_09360 [Propionibacteriaceae bacterium]|nr:hypothetical protein [Propionibacteriaceae bacterium]
MSLAAARSVADAVLYEGYLLYPYRATSAKNQLRWQFGVLGPEHAAEDGLGEDSRLATQCLLRVPVGTPEPEVAIHLRFLQLQQRTGKPASDGGPIQSWDEAAEQEIILPRTRLSALPTTHRVAIPGGQDTEPLGRTADGHPGHIVRTRWPLTADVIIEVIRLGDYACLSIEVRNKAERARTRDEALRTSLLGTHLLLEATGAGFVSLLEPPDDAGPAAASCRQHRCWPVLAGETGATDVVLVSPIILYDYPEVAPESAGALFDSTEIDEILTLRVLTMTEDEKAQARATDPRAQEIIDRCENMTPEELQRLHGVLRDPYAPASPTTPPTWFDTGDQPWWDPEVDGQVQPEVDAVVVDGVRVAKDSLVRLHPSRRADAQDLFFADQVARVTAVLSDVDSRVHVAVVLLDDPAAELHDWYGRYLYFAPDELEPLENGKENQP